MKKLIEVKYSDVLQYYYYLLNDLDVSISTVETIHGLLHPTFTLAVRDDIIRKNPTDGVMAEISKKTSKSSGIRHALTRIRCKTKFNSTPFEVEFNFSLQYVEISY